MILKRITAIVHENRNVRRLEQPRNRADVLWRLRVFPSRLCFEVVERFADKWQILYVEERDVQHVTDNQHGAAGLNHLEYANVHRFAPDRLDQRQHDMASIKHRDGQQIQNRQVYVENHAEPQGQLPAAFALEKQIVDATDSDRPA